MALAGMSHFGKRELSGTFTRVIDGDSLWFGKLEVRLIGIDAPELRQTCSDKQGADFACGRLAAKRLRQLADSGNVSCTSSSIDRYGRHLAVCHSGGLNLNGEMVRQGWAVAYGNATAYGSEENEARKARRGLWNGEFEKPADYRARNRNP